MNDYADFISFPHSRQQARRDKRMLRFAFALMVASPFAVAVLCGVIL